MHLVPDHAVQMTLFDDFKRAESNLKLEQALDSIRARFGNQSIVRGIMLTRSGS